MSGQHNGACLLLLSDLSKPKLKQLHDSKIGTAKLPARTDIHRQHAIADIFGRLRFLDLLGSWDLRKPRLAII